MGNNFTDLYYRKPLVEFAARFVCVYGKVEQFLKITLFVTITDILIKEGHRFLPWPNSPQ
jgi:hypothetical protein